MGHWTTSPTSASTDLTSALQVVDNLFDYMSDGRGKPSNKERALFASAVVFLYGIWENFAECIAIEIAGRVSSEIPPDCIPAIVRATLEKKPAWELAVTPGWRVLWREEVRSRALGDGEKRYGMNSAGGDAVTSLLALAGISRPFEGTNGAIIPSHLKNVNTVLDALDALVKLRGEIVHMIRRPAPSVVFS